MEQRSEEGKQAYRDGYVAGAKKTLDMTAKALGRVGEIVQAEVLALDATLAKSPAEREDLGGGRGLGRYGKPVRDTYGKTTVTVQDSSSADVHACWLRMEGEAHVGEHEEIEEYSPASQLGEHRIPPTRIIKGNTAAHLDRKRAIALRDSLSAWIETTEEEFDG